MSKDRLKFFSNGIFYSKLVYCLPVFGNVFSLDKYRDTETKSVSFTRDDNRRIQVLQNTLMKLITGAPRTTSTTALLQMTLSPCQCSSWWPSTQSTSWTRWSTHQSLIILLVDSTSRRVLMEETSEWFQESGRISQLQEEDLSAEDLYCSTAFQKN